MLATPLTNQTYRNQARFSYQSAAPRHLRERRRHVSSSGRGECSMADADPILDDPTPQLQRRIWDFVSRFPLRTLWNLEGIPVRVIVKHTWRSLLDDNLAGRAAELGFYFIFA